MISGPKIIVESKPADIVSVAVFTAETTSRACETHSESSVEIANPTIVTSFTNGSSEHLLSKFDQLQHFFRVRV